MIHAAESLQSCPTLCDPIDGSPPGCPVLGILQARTLEWIAISISNAWKWKVKVKSLSHVLPSVAPWTAAFHAPPSMGFSRQEYWSGVPLPSPKIKSSHVKIKELKYHRLFFFICKKSCEKEMEGEKRNISFVITVCTICFFFPICMYYIYQYK